MRTALDEIDDHIESAKAEIIRLNDRIVVLTRAKEILIKQREVEQVNTS